MKKVICFLSVLVVALSVFGQAQFHGSFYGNGGGATNVPNWFSGSGYVRVDPRGSDSLGTRNGYPFLTIQAATNALKAYDILYLPAGTNNYSAKNITIPPFTLVEGAGQNASFYTFQHIFLSPTDTLENFSMSGTFPGVNIYSNITLMHVTVDNLHTNLPWVQLGVDVFLNGNYNFCLAEDCNIYVAGDTFIGWYFSSILNCVDWSQRNAGGPTTTYGCINGDNDNIIGGLLYVTNANPGTACIGDDGSYSSTMNIQGVTCVHDGNSYAVHEASDGSGAVTNLGQWFDNGTNVSSGFPMIGDGSRLQWAKFPMVNFTDSQGTTWYTNTSDGVSVGITTNGSSLSTLYQLPGTNTYVNFAFPRQVYAAQSSVWLDGPSNVYSGAGSIYQHASLDIFNITNTAITVSTVGFNPDGNVTQTNATIQPGGYLSCAFWVTYTNNAVTYNFMNAGSPGGQTLLFTGNTNSFFEINVQNVNNGTNASSDIVETAPNGNENQGYFNQGINSQTFQGFGGSSNDAYLIYEPIPTNNYGNDVYFINGRTNGTFKFYGTTPQVNGNYNLTNVLNLSPSNAAFNVTIQGNSSIASSLGFDVLSNTWSLASATNGLAVWATRFTSSNHVPVAIYNSNGVAIVNFLSTPAGGIIP
jgi:hypothetical protein